jgi:hypothetical protein
MNHTTQSWRSWRSPRRRLLMSTWYSSRALNCIPLHTATNPAITYIFKNKKCTLLPLPYYTVAVCSGQVAQLTPVTPVVMYTQPTASQSWSPCEAYCERQEIPSHIRPRTWLRFVPYAHQLGHFLHQIHFALAAVMTSHQHKLLLCIVYFILTIARLGGWFGIMSV